MFNVSGKRSNYGLRKKYYKTRRALRRVRYVQKKWRDNFAATNPKGSEASIAFFGADRASANEGQKMQRMLYGYKGAGDYWSSMQGLGRRFIPAGSFAKAGEWLGSASGIPGMGSLLGYGGKKLADYVGFGDYGSAGSMNQIMAGSSAPPSQQQISVNMSDASGDIIVTRSEFVQNIYVTGTGGSSSSFQLNKFPINAGVAQSFPMLSQIAQNFELYDFKGLIYQYKPTFSENSGSANNLGKIIMATNYDPDAADFFSSVQMENYDYANSTKPSCGAVHGVETDNRQGTIKNYYVRQVNQASKDRSWTDLGNFYLATEGVPISGTGQQTQIIGELWVTYHVKLSRMQLYTNVLGQNIPFCYLGGNTNNTALIANVLSNFASKPGINNLDMKVVPLNATQFRLDFPVQVNLGLFRVTARFFTSAATTSAFGTPQTFINCTAAIPGLALPPGTPMLHGPSNGTGATANSQIVFNTWVLVNSPGNQVASFVIQVTSALPNLTTWDVWVEGANYNSVTALA